MRNKYKNKKGKKIPRGNKTFFSRIRADNSMSIECNNKTITPPKKTLTFSNEKKHISKKDHKIKKKKKLSTTTPHRQTRDDVTCCKMTNSSCCISLPVLIGIVTTLPLVLMDIVS